MDLTVLYQISYGLYVLGAMDGERPVGCVINSVIQVTSENPVLAISLNKDNYTHSAIHNNRRLSLSILSEQTNPNVISAFGFSSSREKDKFDGFSYEIRNGLPILREKCCGALLLDVLSETEMESHTVILARLTDTVALEQLPPMTYSYYHKVIKGSAPKNAPTYQPPVVEKEDGETEEIYVCSVCGYIHHGPLPEEFHCPVCGVDRSHLKKQ